MTFHVIDKKQSQHNIKQTNQHTAFISLPNIAHLKIENFSTLAISLMILEFIFDNILFICSIFFTHFKLVRD